MMNTNDMQDLPPIAVYMGIAMDEDVMASLSRKGESQDALMEAVKVRIKKYKK